jgi:hypothetical protein
VPDDLAAISPGRGVVERAGDPREPIYAFSSISGFSRCDCGSGGIHSFRKTPSRCHGCPSSLAITRNEFGAVYAIDSVEITPIIYRQRRVSD